LSRRYVKDRFPLPSKSSIVDFCFKVNTKTTQSTHNGLTN